MVLGATPLGASDLAALDAVLLTELALAREPLAPEVARAALARAPGSALARLALAALERRAGDLEAARAALVEAAALAPRDAQARVELARLEVARGALEAARGALDEALALDPGAPAARLERAELRLRLGDPGGAADDLRRCQGAVDPLRLRVLQARVAAASGDAAVAADRWLAALRLDPDDPRLLGEAARACAAAGRLEEADRLLARQVDSTPGDPAALLARARVLLDRDRPAPALEAATRAAAVAPSPEVHVTRALALLRLARVDEARQALDAAAAPGETAETLVARALLEVHGASPATRDACVAAARRLLDRTLALDLAAPLPPLLAREGRRHAEAGRPAAAEVAFRLALERDRRALEAHHGLVALLVARGEWAAARDAAGRLLAEHPEDPAGREALDLAERRMERR
ncbi:MAG: tetratricopeptide repeat protein [Planctomycetes bacterium]|nr:tetratricopeptide repeat protein [Planctomycetota bacterium]